MIILACGDRYWTNKKYIYKTLKKIIKKSNDTKHTILHGDCKGADKLSEKATKKLIEKKNYKIKIKSFPAQWHIYARGAGPVRNKQMIDYLLEKKKLEKTCLVIAFHNNYENSKGTINTITQANKAGLETRIYKC